MTPEDLQILHEKLQKGDEPFYSAVIVVSPDQKNFLIGKRKKDGLYTSPAGGAHLGETPKDAAIREAFEEANIRLTPGMLKELPICNLDNGKVCHRFLAVLKEDQEISNHNDPDREVNSWRWHPVDKKLPDEMDENRKHGFVVAKLKLNGINKSMISDIQKSLAESEIPGVNIDTTHYAIEEQSSGCYWTDVLRTQLAAVKPGQAPVSVRLDGSYVLHANQVDHGVYDGHVSYENEKSGDYGETVLRINKMTLPAMVATLKAKGFITEPASPTSEEEVDKVSQSQWNELLDTIKDLKRRQETPINIDIKNENEIENKEDSEEDSEEEKSGDQIPGGIADGMSPSDFPKEAVKQGLLHEMEHTSDPSVALEIALDHLAEDVDYYNKLQEIENKA